VLACFSQIDENTDSLKVVRFIKKVEQSTVNSSNTVAIKICDGDEIILDAGVEGATYKWNTDEVEKTITIYEAGKYKVTITPNNSDNSSSVKIFKVSYIKGPTINRVISEGKDLKVYPTVSGSYEYSLNGYDFQKSNKFKGLKSGAYQFYARKTDSCQVAGAAFRYFKL